MFRTAAWQRGRGQRLRHHPMHALHAERLHACGRLAGRGFVRKSFLVRALRLMLKDACVSTSRCSAAPSSVVLSASSASPSVSAGAKKRIHVGRCVNHMSRKLIRFGREPKSSFRPGLPPPAFGHFGAYILIRLKPTRGWRCRAHTIIRPRGCILRGREP